MENFEISGKAADALEKSQFSQVEMAMNAMVITDENGIIELVNVQTEKLFGYVRADLLGQSVEILLPERFREQHPHHRSTFFANPSPRPMVKGRDLFARRKDGSEFPVEIGLSPITISGRLKVLSEIVDISERKRIETNLIQANERFAIAADAAGLGFWELDITSNSLQWDDWMFRLYGRSRLDGEQPYSLWADNLHPDDRAKSEQEVRDAINGMHNFDTEFRIVHPNGDIRYLKAAASVTCDAKGQPIRMFGVNFDITKRKRIEQVLQESEEQSRMIIENVKDYAIILLNTDGYVVSWNFGAERLKGYRADEIIGQHFSRFYSKEDIDHGKPEKELETAVKGRFEDEGYRIRKDGSRFVANVVLTSIRDDTGQLRGFVKVTRDITERKQAEIHQSQLVKELTRINEELNNFAYIASHDLKSPLRGIDQLATWITEDLGDHLNADVQDHLRLMRNRISRMEMLLDDLLAYSRVGRINEEMVTVNTHDLVQDIFELSATTKQIQLQVTENLPILNAHKAPLALVFRNLINNAIKHHNKSQGCITISARILADSYEFTVADDGPGIAPEHQQRVFGMFQTLKPRDEVEGSGMGLAIVKKAVESVGGTVMLESDGQHGCTFRFTWPTTITIQ